MRFDTVSTVVLVLSGTVFGCQDKGTGNSAVTTSDISSTSSSTTANSTDTETTSSGMTGDASSGSDATSADPSTSSSSTSGSSGSTTGGEACTPEADPPPACRPGGVLPPHLRPGPVDRLSYSPVLPWTHVPDPMEEPTTGAFIPDPDLGGGSECDVWSQDCPSGEKCMPWANDGGGSWNALKCSPIDPNPKAPGETCTVQGNGVSGVDDCELGAMCWGVDPETNEGTCVAMCTCSEATPICESTATTCTISNDGVLILCLPLCDPLDAPCDNGDVCIPNSQGEGFICVLDASGDGGQAGDSCEYINACDPGLICAQAASVEGCAGGVGCCAPLCDLDAAGACPGPNESCVPFYEAGSAPACLDDLGVCTLP